MNQTDEPTDLQMLTAFELHMKKKGLTPYQLRRVHGINDIVFTIGYVDNEWQEWREAFAAGFACAKGEQDASMCLCGKFHL